MTTRFIASVAVGGGRTLHLIHANDGPTGWQWHEPDAMEPGARLLPYVAAFSTEAAALAWAQHRGIVPWTDRK